jgi:hypothetical protein
MIYMTVAIPVATLNQKSPEDKGIASKKRARFIKENN